jgi:hypothetical protein
MKYQSQVFFVLLVVAVTGCGKTSQANKQSADLTNSGIESRIRDGLNSNPATAKANLFVDTDATRKQATISGSAGSDEIRQEAVSIASGAVPGIQVIDQINVAEPKELARATPNTKPAKEVRRQEKNSRRR